MYNQFDLFKRLQAEGVRLNPFDEATLLKRMKLSNGQQKAFLPEDKIVVQWNGNNDGNFDISIRKV